MDLRKKNRFLSFHSDLAGRLQEIGFLFRRPRHLEPAGRIQQPPPARLSRRLPHHKVHEFILLMQKPA